MRANVVAVEKATHIKPPSSSARCPPINGPMIKPMLDDALNRPNTNACWVLDVQSDRKALAKS